jgi:precorrin-3B synthase
MNALAPRQGWCPGVFAPMPAGDGLLVRLRISGASLGPEAAEAIAECASRCGNGEIELTARANIQLRGIREPALADLRRRLGAFRLLDEDAASEALRNIVVSPLAGLDPQAIIDVAPLAAELAAHLGADPRLRGLPAKFGFLLDAGGALPIGDVEADVRFEALRDADGPRFAVTLAGDGGCVALCAPGDLPDAAAALAAAFVRQAGLAASAPRRMLEVAGALGAARLFQAAGLTSAPAPPTLRRRARRGDFVGVHAMGDSFFLGAAPPLGRMTAPDLQFLARHARRCGARDMRITPWRTLLVAGLPRPAAEDLRAALAARFIVAAGDARLSVVACSGAPRCAHAARAVQSEALQLAAALPASEAITLHVSGCRKGCAHPRPASLTLVARQSGYDLIVDGKACDEPDRIGLPLADIAPLLGRLARGGPP